MEQWLVMCDCCCNLNCSCHPGAVSPSPFFFLQTFHPLNKQSFSLLCLIIAVIAGCLTTDVSNNWWIEKSEPLAERRCPLPMIVTNAAYFFSMKIRKRVWMARASIWVTVYHTPQPEIEPCKKHRAFEGARLILRWWAVRLADVRTRSTWTITRWLTRSDIRKGCGEREKGAHFSLKLFPPTLQLFYMDFKVLRKRNAIDNKSGSVSNALFTCLPARTVAPTQCQQPPTLFPMFHSSTLANLLSLCNYSIDGRSLNFHLSKADTSFVKGLFVSQGEVGG